MEFNFNEIIEKLKNEIKNNSINEENFKNACKKYKDLGIELQKIIEYGAKNATGKEKETLEKLYKDFSRQNIATLVDRLRRLGYSLKLKSKKDKDKGYEKVRSALSDQAFRIMERTRHAQRSEVFYMIARIFVVNEKEIPLLLAQAFNPVYSDEVFKTFIYSFLSGILGEETSEGGAE